MKCRFRFLPLYFFLLLLLSSEVRSQSVERATPHAELHEASGSMVQDRTVRLRERHVTLELIESEEGREAIERFHRLRERGYYEERTRLLEIPAIGDRREFFVRNLEESAAGNILFDELEFELVRMSSDLDTGERVEIWAVPDELGPDKVSESILDQMLEGMTDRTPANSIEPQRGVVEISRSLFGDQPGADGVGVLKVLIADLQDGWEEGGDNLFTAGFFDPVNLLPRSQSSFSNEADIIYINSLPGLYREGIGPIGPRLNTIAHELQHLIHAGYDRLSTFQNEGQSELAEILTGFSARPMNFLNSGTEMRGDVQGSQRWIYRFRREAGDVVLFDYQRAQLLHGYLEELVGPVETGSLTRSTQTRDAAYREILERNDTSWQEFLTGFYVTAYANRRQGEASGFTRPQLANVRVANPGVFYGADRQPWIFGREERLYYGGALYTKWFGVEELSLTIEASEGISQRLLYRKRGDRDFTLLVPESGEFLLGGDGSLYEEVVLVSVNHTPQGSSATAAESRVFRYNAIWEPTDLVLEELSYHGDAALFFPLPDGQSYALGVRISSDIDASVESVRFTVNPRESALRGQGSFELSLREASTSTINPNVLVPGPVIASQQVSTNDISLHENHVGVDSEAWLLEADEEYFVVMEVVEDEGGLYVEFLMDEGSEDTEDVNYFPARTYVGIREGGEHLGWSRFNRNNNLLMAVSLVGFRETGRPEFPEGPVSASVELLANYPNPFSGQTTIPLSLPEEAEIEISIHDILGRRVDRIFSGSLPAGVHRLPYDAGHLASGIYFYRLRYSGGSLSRRMTLLR